MSCQGSNLNCPVDTTLHLIGGKYKSLILWHLIGGTLRYGEIHKLMPQATPKMLTQQLRELERDKIIIREVFPVVPPKVEYSLTDLGRSLQSILTSMYKWGEHYMKENNCEISCSMTMDLTD